MNINRINPVDAINQVTNNEKIKQVNRAERTESISISPEVREMAETEMLRVRDMVRASPDIREDKVNDIKTRMDNGRYNISSMEIARKMLTG